MQHYINNYFEKPRIMTNFAYLTRSAPHNRGPRRAIAGWNKLVRLATENTQIRYI